MYPILLYIGNIIIFIIAMDWLLMVVGNGNG